MDVCFELLRAGVKRREIKLNSKGDSMLPLVVGGRRLVVKPAKRLKLGDFICFYQNDSLTAHRIVGFQEDMLLTKGDNCMRFDAPINRNQVIGKVENDSTEILCRFLAAYSFLEGKIYSLTVGNSLFKILSGIKCRYITKKPVFIKFYRVLFKLPYTIVLKK
ncbi:MAG: S26 family signal peptidase [Candidatus Altiarchaeota archaeon]|nr:S26 family signal peptidase [Candidatus Altiarchaeota archaeon]